jgi:hypothetical protein
MSVDLPVPVIELVDYLEATDIILGHQVFRSEIIIQCKYKIRQPDITGSQQSFIYGYQRLRIPDLFIYLVDQSIRLIQLLYQLEYLLIMLPDKKIPFINSCSFQQIDL